MEDTQSSEWFAVEEAVPEGDDVVVAGGEPGGVRLEELHHHIADEGTKDVGRHEIEGVGHLAEDENRHQRRM